MRQKILVFLADGFEEIEAVTPVDILRRLELDTVLVGVGSKQVRGAHGIEIVTDTTINRIKKEEATAVILPGGMPGARNLDSNPIVREILLHAAKSDWIIGAICAAPMVLGRLGLLNGKNAVCYPGFEEHLAGATIVDSQVVRDGNIITARGPGAASEFGFEIGAAVSDRIRADFVKKSMMYK